MQAATRERYPAIRLSNQLFKAGLRVPAGFRHIRTSALLNRGLVAWSAYPGIPIYAPIGAAVLAQIESELIRQATKVGFDRVQIPSIMRNSDLSAGEPVGKQFHGKIMFLRGLLDGYHLLTSPEMVLAMATEASTLSHRNLPIQVSYATDIFRQVSDTTSFLRCRQFRVFGCLSIGVAAADIHRYLTEMVALTESALAKFQIKAQALWVDEPKHVELLYACPEGDTRIDEPSRKEGRAKALSIAVGSHYAAGRNLPVRYHTSSNMRRPVMVASYAVCTNRLLYAAFDQHRDELGFCLPALLRPFDVVLIPCDSSCRETAVRLCELALDAGYRAVVDDRFSMRIDQRMDFAAYVGAPVTLHVAEAMVSYVQRDGRVEMRIPVDCSAEILASLEKLLALAR